MTSLKTDIAKTEMEETLTKIVKNPTLHNKFLNTISFLEHMGSRKILSTQDIRDMSESLLRHASEEARHAHFFKKMAGKIGQMPETYEWENLLAGYSAFHYFQNLDLMVQRGVEDSQLTNRQFHYRCYQYTSLIIEERAGWLYHIYRDVLANNGNPFSLDGVIAEEEKHLEDAIHSLQNADDDFESRMDFFRKGESDLFLRYYGKLKEKI